METTVVQLHFCIIALVLALIGAPHQIQAQAVSVDPAKMPRVGTVDQRFASYNIELAEVTGGNFWKPYGSGPTAPGKKTAQSVSAPAGMDPNMYHYRPPIDLSNPQLRKLASALGPAYVRVSGTWANSVYFGDSDNLPDKAQAGFSGVLTRKNGRTSSIFCTR